MHKIVFVIYNSALLSVYLTLLSIVNIYIHSLKYNYSRKSFLCVTFFAVFQQMKILIHYVRKVSDFFSII